jgi:hypothetical protein
VYIYNQVPHDINQQTLRFLAKFKSNRLKKPLDVVRLGGLWHLAQHKFKFAFNLDWDELLHEDVYSFPASFFVEVHLQSFDVYFLSEIVTNWFELGNFHNIVEDS